MDFFASLTIYKLPLRVIYTGLMVMLFKAQTACRDLLGRQGGGWCMCECVKYCTETPPAAANSLWGERGEWGATLEGQGNAAAECRACRQEHSQCTL